MVRAAGSKGACDLVALRAKQQPVLQTALGHALASYGMLVSVKADTSGPWENFRPAERARLLEAAALADCDAVLAWWPPGGTLQWFPPSEWPK